MYTVHCILDTVYGTLYTVHSLLYTVHCILQCTLYVDCTLYSVPYCTMYTVYFTVHFILYCKLYCTLFTVHCTVYCIVHCVLQWTPYTFNININVRPELVDLQLCRCKWFVLFVHTLVTFVFLYLTEDMACYLGFLSSRSCEGNVIIWLLYL